MGRLISVPTPPSPRPTGCSIVRNNRRPTGRPTLRTSRASCR